MSLRRQFTVSYSPAHSNAGTLTETFWTGLLICCLLTPLIFLEVTRSSGQAWILAVFGSSDKDLLKLKQMALTTVVGLQMVSDRADAPLSDLQADEDAAMIATVMKIDALRKSSKRASP